MQTTKLQGQIVSLQGVNLSVGDKAPKVSLVSQNLKQIKVASDCDKIQVIVSLPSLDTQVCEVETKRFNEEALKVKNIEIIITSMDLPFAMSRFCKNFQIENVIMGSDFRNKDLANDYGLLMKDGALEGLMCRAVFVIKNNIIIYKEICEDIVNEPNYEDILNILKGD